MAVVTKAERLRQARRHAEYRYAADAARAMGISNSTYVHHENGTRDFPNDAAELYARRFGVDFDWLVRGVGKMIAPGTPSHIKPAGNEQVSEEQRLLEEIEDKIEREEADREDNQKRMRGLYSIPLVSPTYAFKSDPLKHQWSRFVDLQTRVSHPIVTYWGIPEMFLSDTGTDGKTLILYPYIGDYMSPTYNDGDLLFVNTGAEDIVSDGLYLVADRNSAPQFRRVRRIFGSNPSRVTLTCDNTTISPQEVPVDDLLVIGHVVGHISAKP